MLEAKGNLPLDLGNGTQSAESVDSSSPAWVLRRSPRARRLALRVHQDGKVEVVVPRGVPDALVRGFVERHADWVRRKLAERPHPRTVEPFPPPHLDLPALQQRFRIHMAGGRGRPRLRVYGEGLLSLGGDLGGEPLAAQRLLLRWLLAHAHAELEPRLRELEALTDLRYQKLQLRRQRTRWGSCSSRGVISLNVCAVFQSPEVLRYLMVHELSHTRHMNHSPAYWRTVAAHCADYRRLDRELSRGWQHVPTWVFR